LSVTAVTLFQGTSSWKATDQEKTLVAMPTPTVPSTKRRDRRRGRRAFLMKANMM